MGITDEAPGPLVVQRTVFHLQLRTTTLPAISLYNFFRRVNNKTG
jgi:hypothetical protein